MTTCLFDSSVEHCRATNFMLTRRVLVAMLSPLLLLSKSSPRLLLFCSVNPNINNRRVASWIMDDSHNGGSVLNTTRTSIEIVEIINNSGGASLQEIVDETELARSTAYTHLNTLREHEYLTKEGNQYHLGLRLFHLGTQAKNRTRAYRIAGDVVEKLAEETDEDVTFIIETGDQLIAIHNQIGYQAARTGRTGDYFDYHSTAIGKAILAKKSPDEVQRILTRLSLTSQTQNTITTEERLRNELETIREQGYAINDEELEKGYRGVGVAATYPTGSVIGGFSIGGPVYRLNKETLQNEYAELLMETVTRYVEKLLR